MYYTAQIPDITAAVIDPNPAAINAPVMLRVTVTERTVILEPYYYYSGDIFSGEV